MAGGAIAEFVSIAQHRKKAWKDWPKYVRRLSYWLVAIGNVALGGFFAYLYNKTEGVQLNQLLAVNIGATAPLIAEGLVRGSVPKLPPGDAS